jgi:amino acid transporter
MNDQPLQPDPLSEDERTLARMGYAQELHRGMGAFSNFALSLSIICILAGGVTSFYLGLCSVGGASIGLGWPLACLFSLIVALTMGQVASAFPTAGGLYHWAAILGGAQVGMDHRLVQPGRLVTVLAAINVGTYQFTVWVVALASVGFTIYTPVYSTISVVCALLLYTSYVLPAALGMFAYGRTWTEMGPWDLGRWYRPLALVCVLGCVGLFIIGVQPPNDKALTIMVGFVGVLGVWWFAVARRRFPGPPGRFPS